MQGRNILRTVLHHWDSQERGNCLEYQGHSLFLKDCAAWN